MYRVYLGSPITAQSVGPGCSPEYAGIGQPLVVIGVVNLASNAVGTDIRRPGGRAPSLPAPSPPARLEGKCADNRFRIYAVANDTRDMRWDQAWGPQQRCQASHTRASGDASS